MLKPILIAVFISAVILVECAVAYLLIPSTSDLEGWAKKKEGEHAAAGEHATPGEHGQKGKEEHQGEHSPNTTPKWNSASSMSSSISRWKT